ncbi:glycosyltransferase [uncultured Acetobacteroides sp.]|uniref:glycosyltransferase n=1 Tax=uncultured Acetobacteroides sp. TaxID=1760811 RepID=UPI0029F59DBC|nr:glycosyltransferase [uncultured Acetobacteroides sp.]
MKVLVAPLNWGVGHATRCIPIIHFLLKRGDDVHIAGDGQSLELLQSYFPQLAFHELPLLTITYTKHLPLYAAFPRMAARMLIHYFKDRRAIRRLMEQEHFECIFSDNRYGIRSAEAKSYLITHQLHVCFGCANSWLERLSARIIRRLIRPFNACLVPDYDSDNNLAGKIDKPNGGLKVLYTGPQSRFPLEEPDIPLPRYDLLIILSGPEPQRTKFERIVASLSACSAKRIMLVRGTKDAPNEPLPVNLNTLDFAGDLMLQTLIRNSKAIVARAGYSTIMDLNALGRGAVLVPTPHQPEQEYLATWLDGKRGFVKAGQNEKELQEWF